MKDELILFNTAIKKILTWEFFFTHRADFILPWGNNEMQVRNKWASTQKQVDFHLAFLPSDWMGDTKVTSAPPIWVSPWLDSWLHTELLIATTSVARSFEAGLQDDTQDVGNWKQIRRRGCGLFVFQKRCICNYSVTFTSAELQWHSMATQWIRDCHPTEALPPPPPRQ